LTVCTVVGVGTENTEVVESGFTDSTEVETCLFKNAFSFTLEVRRDTQKATTANDFILSCLAFGRNGRRKTFENINTKTFSRPPKLRAD
jgi:hypothetical protein